MEAFATVADLEARLGRSFTGPELTKVEALLADASDHLRSVIGHQVYPASQVTYVAYPADCRVTLPAHPVVSVDSVQRDGQDVEFSYRPPHVWVEGREAVTVTFTHGYSVAPAELMRLTCVLVSQALLTLDAQVGLSAGGLASIAIDDFRVAWANAGGESGIALTKHAEDGIRRRFGTDGASVVGVSW